MKCPYCKTRPLLNRKNAKTCGDPDCNKARKKAYNEAYQKAYHKAYHKAYNERPENKARNKARMKAYNEKPENKARKKAYDKAYHELMTINLDNFLLSISHNMNLKDQKEFKEIFLSLFKTSFKNFLIKHKDKETIGIPYLIRKCREIESALRIDYRLDNVRLRGKYAKARQSLPMIIKFRKYLLKNRDIKTKRIGVS